MHIYDVKSGGWDSDHMFVHYNPYADSIVVKANRASHVGYIDTNNSLLSIGVNDWGELEGVMIEGVSVLYRRAHWWTRFPFWLKESMF